MSDYRAFLDAKMHVGNAQGFAPSFLPSFLFDFQTALVDHAVRMGRSAIFADCGLGKTPMQLAWAQNVVEHTNKPVLILTPLAVAAQTVREADKFQIPARKSAGGSPLGAEIIVTNYDKLHLFNAHDFAGVVCDESSILKSFDGATRAAVTAFMQHATYRLLCTATAAPNDYIELGTGAEALGVMKYREMLARFFTHDGGDTAKWRLKGHTKDRLFWQWMCSWSRAIRQPSDLGFDNARFVLPPLVERDHTVAATHPSDGMLFRMPAVGLDEQREERRRTIVERCAKVAELVATTEQAIVWCHLNAEGDLLASMIPDACHVSGADDDEAKEEAFLAFAAGESRVLVTKPRIGAWGLNFQNCAHMTFFPSHSFEQYYQGVRRCWRFGQSRRVVVDVVTTEGEQMVMRNLQRKADQADAMFANIVAHMSAEIMPTVAAAYPHTEQVPAWL